MTTSPDDAMSPTPTPTPTPAVPPPVDINTAALIEMASIRGQLQTVIQLMHQSNAETHRRIDDLGRSLSARVEDLRDTVDQRFQDLDTRLGGMEERIETVEERERTTAMRTAAWGGGAAALVTATMEAIKHLPAITR